MSDTSASTVVEFPKKSAKTISSHERIWGKPVLTHGYTALPSILIQAQSRLGITPLQFNIPSMSRLSVIEEASPQAFLAFSRAHVLFARLLADKQIDTLHALKHLLPRRQD